MATSTLPKPDSDYDADADERYAPRAQGDLEAPSGQSQGEISDDDLRQMTGIGADEEASYLDRAQKGEPDDEAKPGGAADASQLNEAEQLGKGYTPNTEGGEGGEKEEKKKKNGLIGRVRNSSKAKKAAIILGAGTGVSILLLVLFLLLMLANMLKIPDLAQNITTYEFARMSRQFADSAQESSDEALALQGTDDATYTGLRGALYSAQDKVNTMWSKLDNYRPGKIASSLKSSEALKYNYTKPGIFGRQRLASISILNQDGTYSEVPTINQGFSRFVPGIKDVVKTNNDAQFLANLRDGLEKSELLDDIGPIIRGRVANAIRKELGIGLSAWVLSKFKDASSEPAAQVEETEQRAQAVDENADNQPNTSSGTDAIDKTTSDVEEAEEQAATSGTAVQQAINNNGILSSVSSALKTGLEESGLDKVASALNPAEEIAQPICIAGSAGLNNSGSTIDKQTTQTQAAYYYVASAGDQEKAGVQAGDSDPDQASELDAAAGGLNDSLGNTTTSNAYIRASGGTVSTSGTISPEASAGGQFTLADALFGSNAVSGIINDVMNTACPLLTNPGLSAALAGINFASGIADFGSTDAAEKAAATAATDATTTTVKSMFVNLITRYLGDNAGRATELLYDTGKGTITTGISLAAITIMSRLIVLSRSGQMFSGFSMGTDLANDADAGGNIQASELERTQLFGRPLTETEVCQSNQADDQYVYAQEASRSAYDRYLSPSYADSLLSRTAVTFGDDFNTSYGSGLLSSIGSALFRPFTSFGWLSSLFMGKTFADATTDCNDNVTDYGDVQFGWSQDEENLIQGNVTYQPIENQHILDESGEEAAIASKYAYCFGYSYNPSGNGDFDPTDTSGDLALDDGPDESGSLGTVLADGLIIRDTNGNVIDAGDPTQAGNYGLCSPSNLSYNSTDPLAADPDSESPKLQDLIFRFRLAMRYDTTVDQLSNMETVTSD